MFFQKTSQHYQSSHSSPPEGNMLTITPREALANSVLYICPSRESESQNYNFIWFHRKSYPLQASRKQLREKPRYGVLGFPCSPHSLPVSGPACFLPCALLPLPVMPCHARLLFGVPPSLPFVRRIPSCARLRSCASVSIWPRAPTCLSYFSSVLTTLPIPRPPETASRLTHMTTSRVISLLGYLLGSFVRPVANLAFGCVWPAFFSSFFGAVPDWFQHPCCNLLKEALKFGRKSSNLKAVFETWMSEGRITNLQLP